MKNSIFTSVLLAVFLGAVPVATAETGAESGLPDQARDDEMARKLFETGRAYFERAKYDDAAAAFGEAFSLSGRNTLLVNQARALESAGRVQEAVATLEKFLELERHDEAARESVSSMLRRLRAEAARLEAAASAREEAASQETEVDAAPEMEPAAPLQLEPAPRISAGKVAGFSALSLGGVSAIVALGTGLSSRQKMNSLEAECPMNLCPPELQGEIDRGHRLGVTSTVFTFVGVAAAASGVLVLLLTREPKDDPEAARVELTPGPAARGAALRVTF